ncbi:MAG: BCD family MFS transporter [Betaproteobacteria bacterium]|nr:BCD family MFS transporter [Betaproteobacteria bacterium]
MTKTFGWAEIIRLGAVQASLGAIVVLMTSTLNRIMVVELALPALLPGALVALHYLVQVSRPRMGHGSDQGSRRTPWIIGGMAVLAIGAIIATLATLLMNASPVLGLLLSVAGFVMIGLGVGAAGTSLLVLLAMRVAAERRAAAATTVWLMMIVGFAVTAGTAGQLLDPYTPVRLLGVTISVCAMAMAITLIALFRVEHDPGDEEFLPHHADEQARVVPFRVALNEVWQEPLARQFTVFIFVSMLAYSAQDLILEPFAGTVFGYTPGESTSLSGVQHAGVLVGMLLVALVGSRFARGRVGSLKLWCVGGCIASAAALAGLAVAGHVGPPWPLKANVFLMGAANGAFSIAAIGQMMRLATEGRAAREGVRMGLWGAAQAIAFGFGGLLGTAASDLAHWLIASTGVAYGSVFALEAVLFIASALLASRMTIGSKPIAAAREHSAQPSFS